MDFVLFHLSSRAACLCAVVLCYPARLRFDDERGGKIWAAPDEGLEFGVGVRSEVERREVWCFRDFVLASLQIIAFVLNGVRQVGIALVHSRSVRRDQPEVPCLVSLVEAQYLATVVFGTASRSFARRPGWTSPL